MKKTKIILDADVIIHFAKGDRLNLLPRIFKDYEYAILDTVYEEIRNPTKTQLDNQIHFFENITHLRFEPTGEMRKEYAMLSSKLGKGESACLVYCRYHHDVIGSSNLKDIKEYCQQYELTYLTTLDFLYYAVKRHIMTVEEANQFISDVNSKGSKLPVINIETYPIQVLM